MPRSRRPAPRPRTTGSDGRRATQEKAFEPFFTTKEAGQGTGLGLAIVYGIVKQSGGHIWLYSEPGRGTAFKLDLPCAAGEAAPPAPAPQARRALRGTEKILVVEDDAQVHALVRAILGRHGYNVIEGASPAEAPELEERSDGAGFHLLLSDVVMPGVSGPQLWERLAAVRPGLRVLFMSGYAESAVVHHRVFGAGSALVQKPLTPESLLRRVREVLDGARSGKTSD